MDSNDQQAGGDDGSRVTSRVISRDYAADETNSRATSQSGLRSRYQGFNFGPASHSLRHRLSNIATSPSPGPTYSFRGFEGIHDSTRRSVAIAPTSTIGDRERDGDTESRKFSLAGPQVFDTLAANQPYVDPLYKQINPAYDQPVNVRPVWGLAKPLPRVLRPGMVPAKDELDKDELSTDRDAEAQPLLDTGVEAGRIEPTLRPRVSMLLDTVRRERELALIRAYEHSQNQYNDSPAFSPYAGLTARHSSDAPTVTQSARVRLEEPIEEESSSDTPAADDATQPDIQPPELNLPEAVANLKQAKSEAAESLKDPYEDAIPLSAYSAEDDEVHNLHTYWSVIRLRFREPLAELLAVCPSITLIFPAPSSSLTDIF
jgi:aquaglyceroporin related protein, other eukaryote